VSLTNSNGGLSALSYFSVIIMLSETFDCSLLPELFLGILKKHIIIEPAIAKQLNIKKRVVFFPPYLSTRAPIRFPDT
jgi:hypothetical protein